MVSTYSVIFNSGQGTQFEYEPGGNVDYFTITNSDQSYYQNASLRIHNLSTDNEGYLDLNNTLKIYIDNELEFDGYVNRIQKSLEGVRVYDIQAIGRTYDLWRFITSSNTKYNSKYSSYIVSSLVHDYCSGNGVYISPPKIGSTLGSYINEITFSDMEIGSCIGRMAQMDGYSFFVDSDKVLNYYQPKLSPQFTVDESDVIEMSPHEKSDDSMRNSILVIGSVEYEKYSENTESPDGYYYISGHNKSDGAISDATYIAQRMKIPNNLHFDRLSSVKLYVDRSSGDNTPYYLKGSIRKDDDGSPSSNSTIFPVSNAFVSSDSMKFIGTDIMSPPDWTPYYSYPNPDSIDISGGQTIWLVFNYDGASSDKYWKLAYSNLSNLSYGEDPDGNGLKITNDPNLVGTLSAPYSGSIPYKKMEGLGDKSCGKCGNTSYWIGGEYGILGPTNRMYGTTFTVGTIADNSRYLLSGVSIYCFISGLNGDEIIKQVIYTLDDDDKPKDVLITKSLAVGEGDVMPSGGINDADWFWFPFSTNTYLEGGRKYALVYSGQTSGSTAAYTFAEDRAFNIPVSSSFSDPYVGGKLYRINSAQDSNTGELDSTYIYFNISSTAYPYNYGSIDYDSSHEHIIFHVSSVGLSPQDGYTSGSIRYKEFGITGGGITTDLGEFIISCNIENYTGGNYTSQPKSDAYEKYHSKLIFGLFDPTSPGGNDYNPTMGFEFNLDLSSQRKLIYNETTTVGTQGFYGAYWHAQTFTSDFPFILTDLYSYTKKMLGGTITFWAFIEKTDASHHPDGNPLASGSVTTSNGNFLFHRHNMNNNIYISANMEYAIVLKCEHGDTSNCPAYGKNINVSNPYEDGSCYVTTDGGSSWQLYTSWASWPASYDDMPFKLYGFVDKAVRPVLCTNIDDSTPQNPQYVTGDWFATGAKTYKCQLDGSNFLFYIDGSLKQTWDVSNVTLNGNYKFGAGNEYDWSGFRFILVDGAGCKYSSGTIGEISGNIKYISVPATDLILSRSTDSGQTWTNDSSKHLLYSIGWNYDNVRGEAESDTIDKYGKHFYKVNENLLNTYVDCENYAERLMDTYQSGISTGEITIDGRTDVDIKTKFRYSGTNLDLKDKFVISQYEQIFDKDGFRTKIIYGEAPYDIARKVANLESEVYE